MKLVWDLETDGLREECTCIWCFTTKDITTGNVVAKEYSKNISEFFSLMEQSEFLIGHNIISFDLVVLEKLYGWTPRKETKIVDTLVLSRLLNPDREGGHSLDAWGKKLGRFKPKHEDWTQYSEEMLHRCSEDVEINHLMYIELLREMNE